jgi:DNA-binding PadR family transcriptional regulator
MDTDLSSKDVKFLRAVQDVNTNPESYPKTVDHNAEVPATKKVISSGSELSMGEVRYRVDRGNRLLDNGLIQVHNATFNDELGMFDPKSVSLTEAGEEALSEVEIEDSSVDSEELEHLRSRIEELESSGGGGSGGIDASKIEEFDDRLSSLEQSVAAIGEEFESMLERFERIEQNKWGGISDENAEDMEKLLRRGAGMFYAFDELLSIDIDELVANDGVDPERVEAVQEQIFTELASASSGGQSQSGGEDGQASPGQSARPSSNEATATEDPDMDRLRPD